VTGFINVLRTVRKASFPLQNRNKPRNVKNVLNLPDPRVYRGERATILPLFLVIPGYFLMFWARLDRCIRAGRPVLHILHILAKRCKTGRKEVITGLTNSETGDHQHDRTTVTGPPEPSLS